MITIRKPEDIYRASGRITNGTFQGRWHFSFDEYDDPEYIRFGTLRVFNDDTLSPVEVKIGSKSGGYFELIDGLHPGERVVTSANFLIDSESSLKAALEAVGKK